MLIRPRLPTWDGSREGDEVQKRERGPEYGVVKSLVFLPVFVAPFLSFIYLFIVSLPPFHLRLPSASRNPRHHVDQRERA